MMQTDAVHTRLLLSFPLHLFTIVYKRFHFVHPFAWVDAVDPIFFVRLTTHAHASKHQIMFLTFYKCIQCLI